MVLESLIQSDKIKKNFWFIVMLCFCYVFISYFVGSIFFGEAASVVTVFTLTLFLLPSLTTIISLEERIESKHGLHHFFKNNKLVFYTYCAAFLGIFIGYLFLGSLSDYGVSLELQKAYLEKSKGIDKDVIDGFLAIPPQPELKEFLGLVSQNVGVAVICFILSLFYGAGAIFLIIWNGSISAAFLIFIFRNVLYSIQQNITMTDIFMIHMIPEIGGFIFAAIAGAIFSQAILTEKFRSRKFRNVMKNVCMLFLLAMLLVFVAAFLEIMVSRELVYAFLNM